LPIFHQRSATGSVFFECLVELKVFIRSLRRLEQS
jgi:hypothetical protein